MKAGNQPREIAILGGGLAGLSLALQLVRQGVGAHIAVLEPRTAYADDRTWCFWDTDPHPFAEDVTHRWSAWRVTTGAGGVTAHGGRYAYCRLPARRVYERAVAELEAAPRVTLHTGVRVESVTDTGAGLDIATTAGRFAADLAFDGRPPALADWADGRHPFLWQDFEGWRIKAAPGSYDPATADLMDFRQRQGRGVRFLYVLPLSDSEAIVETTAFAPARVEPACHHDELTRTLDRRMGAGAYTIEGREHGRIPMTTAPPPPTGSAKVIPIGTRAGAPRPSTGYAFLAIQRHSAAVARRVAAGRPGAVPMRDAVTTWLDRVFLTRVMEDPEAAPELFRRMFARAPADRLVRFLSERGGPLDHLAVMAALPTLPFLRTALAPVPSRPAGIRAEA